MRSWLVFLALSVGAAQAAAAGTAGDMAADAAIEARVARLAAELRCLVCQNQSLADSNADLALQLKAQVRDQLRAGRSEPQVLAYMTERYGDFVLYRPPFKATTALLWAGPAVLLAIGVGALAWSLRNKVPPGALSDADAARAAALLDR